MALEIHAIPIGPDNVYAVKDRGTILAGGGAPGKFDLVLPVLLESGDALVGDLAMNGRAFPAAVLRQAVANL